MKKQDCKAALEVYKKFVNRMERVSAFLSVAEDVGIDKGDIPDLTQAPGSLLTALENHLQSLEKGKTFKPPSKYVIISRYALVFNTKDFVNRLGVEQLWQPSVSISVVLEACVISSKHSDNVVSFVFSDVSMIIL